MRKKEQGAFTVEFAIIAVALFIILFTVMELARIIWVWNSADEATRRGARVAAVCTVGHDAVAEATIFAAAGSGGPSPIIKGLQVSNVVVEYLDENGNSGADFSTTRYVRVSLKDFEIEPLIPFIDATFKLPPFTTTIPSESLGLIPNPGDPTATTECGCFLSPYTRTSC